MFGEIPLMDSDTDEHDRDAEDSDYQYIDLPPSAVESLTEEGSALLKDRHRGHYVVLRVQS